MADDKKDEQGGQSPEGSLSREKGGPAVKDRKRGPVRRSNPAGADIKLKKDAAQRRVERAEAKQADKQQVSNPSLAQPDHDKELDEVRRWTDQRREDLRHLGRTEIEVEVNGIPDGDKKDDDGGTLLFQSVGGHVYVSCSRKEITFGHDEMVQLVLGVQRLVQAAS
jgi:ubiquitin